MSALLALVGPKLIGFVVAALAALAALFRYRSSIIKAERAKQAAGKLAAAEDRLEMDREATAAEREAAGMSDAAASKEAQKWARR